jgi:hypothetical protein
MSGRPKFELTPVDPPAPARDGAGWGARAPKTRCIPQER